MELEAFFETLSRSGIKPSILSIVPKYCEEYIPRIEQGVLPKPLTCLFNPDMLEVTELSGFSDECDKVFSSLEISKEQCEAVEEATRTQSQSKLWYMFRAGRITASKFRNSVLANLCKPPASLIKQICYPESHRFELELRLQSGVLTMKN